MLPLSLTLSPLFHSPRVARLARVSGNEPLDIFRSVLLAQNVFLVVSFPPARRRSGTMRIRLTTEFR